MYAIIKRLDDGATVPAEVITVEFNRMAPNVYADIVKKLPQIAVTNDTSPMQAGYQLGVQAVLKLLRDGYVV